MPLAATDGSADVVNDPVCELCGLPLTIGQRGVHLECCAANGGLARQVATVLTVEVQDRQGQGEDPRLRPLLPGQQVTPSTTPLAYAGLGWRIAPVAATERNPRMNSEPKLWRSGMIVVHRSGTQHVLDQRKGPGDTPGWWLVDGGGIADWVASGSDWIALTPDVIRGLFTMKDDETANG